MNRPRPPCRGPDSGRIVNLISWLLANFLLWAPGSAIAADTVSGFEFLPGSTTFEPWRGTNSDALFRMRDLLQRVAPAADFQIVLLGSVAPGCTTTNCLKSVELRARVEAVVDALTTDWPRSMGRFPAERLRWASESAENAGDLHRLRLRIAQDPSESPDTRCPFTVELTEPEWPPSMEDIGSSPWLTLSPRALPLSVNTNARLRVRYQGASTAHVEIQWVTGVLVERLHAGPWGLPKLPLALASLPSEDVGRLVLQAWPDSGLSGALADSLPRGARGISDQLLAWPMDSDFGQEWPLLETESGGPAGCVFQFRVSDESIAVGRPVGSPCPRGGGRLNPC